VTILARVIAVLGGVTVRAGVEVTAENSRAAVADIMYGAAVAGE
jgi:hypothetical protein